GDLRRAEELWGVTHDSSLHALILLVPHEPANSSGNAGVQGIQAFRDSGVQEKQALLLPEPGADPGDDPRLGPERPNAGTPAFPGSILPGGRRRNFPPRWNLRLLSPHGRIDRS